MANKACYALIKAKKVGASRRRERQQQREREPREGERAKRGRESRSMNWVGGRC